MSFFDDALETMSKGTDVVGEGMQDGFDYFNPQQADGGLHSYNGTGYNPDPMGSMEADIKNAMFAGTQHEKNKNKPAELGPVVENPFQYLFD